MGSWVSSRSPWCTTVLGLCLAWSTLPFGTKIWYWVTKMDLWRAQDNARMRYRPLEVQPGNLFIDFCGYKLPVPEDSCRSTNSLRSHRRLKIICWFLKIAKKHLSSPNGFKRTWIFSIFQNTVEITNLCNFHPSHVECESEVLSSIKWKNEYFLL